MALHTDSWPSPQNSGGSGHLESHLEGGWLPAQTLCLMRRDRGGPNWETLLPSLEALELNMGLHSFLCFQLTFIQSRQCLNIPTTLVSKQYSEPHQGCCGPDHSRL